MEILVCVKRVPTVGGVITLTADQRAIEGHVSLIASRTRRDDYSYG